MPLNPNGKIDKPALPFPDTAAAASVAVEPRSTTNKRKTTATEETIRSIWAAILPNAPTPVPIDENFFDIGGHSILATRLIFEIRKTFVVDAPLGLIFDQPTITGLAAGVDSLRYADLGLASGATDTSPNAATIMSPSVPDYASDVEKLLPKLRETYPPIATDLFAQPVTVFLTGATGFLGAFILRDLLYRQSTVHKVICLVRASSDDKALDRLRQSTSDRGVWNEGWVETGRLEIVRGDLDQELFGLGQSTWDRIANEAHVVVHNGALVSLNNLAMSRIRC
jgi:L-2-aminoadipate reductase